MGNTFFLAWEPQIIEWFQSFESNLLTALATGISMFSEKLILMFIIGLLYWCIDKDLCKKSVTYLLAAFLWGPNVQGCILRRRPYMDIVNIKCIRPAILEYDIMNMEMQGSSCPSLHATMSTAFYGSFGLKKTKCPSIIIGICLPLLIGLTRIYFGIHYPTDVLFGWILGSFILVFISLLMSHIKRVYITYLVILLIGLPGIFYCHDNAYFTALGMSIGFFASFIFDDCYVKFKNTKSIKKWIVRLLLGSILFFILNTLLKISFNSYYLSPGSTLSLIVQTLRYSIVVFVVMGIYPIAFDKTKFF